MGGGARRKIYIALLGVLILSLGSIVYLYYASDLFMDRGDQPGEELYMEIYLSPTCSCCHQYISYLIQNGIKVKRIFVDDLLSVKNTYGVPQNLWSCHTGIIDGYVVEGHIPVEVIVKMLNEKPDIAGIALPGMPPGSPGMPGAFSELVIYYFTGQDYGVYAIYR